MLVKSNMIIDFLLMVGGRSGLELALNRTADFFNAHGHKIRIFQVIISKIQWATNTAEYYNFNMDSTVDLNRCISYYEERLVNAPLPSAIIVTGIPELLPVPKLAVSNLGLAIPIIFWPQNSLNYYGISTSANCVLENADIIFATNNSIANYISTYFHNKLVYRVYNPINPDTIIFSKNRNSNHIAFVGRLSPEKNISLIIEAIHKSSVAIFLTIIGEGSEKNKIIELCKTYGCLDKVKFIGWNQNPWKYVNDHRCLVISSVDNFEGGPMSAIEALACGLPVISTPVGFMPEFISPGNNGYIYPFDDPDALSDILSKIVTEDFNPSTSEACRQSVADFMPEVALWDFMCKTIASSRLIGLPQRNWNDKDKRLIKSKASVLIANVGISDSFFIEQLDSMCKQSIEPRYYEIVIIYSKNSEDTASRVHDYESIHPDNIILIELTETSIEKKEAYEIGLTYATGDMIFSLENIDYILSSHQVENWYMDKICGL